MNRRFRSKGLELSMQHIYLNKQKFLKTLENHAAWLKNKKTGRRANFEGCNFRGVTLINRDLRHVNFKNTDFRGSDLLGSDFSNANFKRADFRGADLSGSDFSNADLRESKLHNADMRWVTLVGATLTYVNLDGADLRWANMLNVDSELLDLSETKLYKTKLPLVNFRVRFSPVSCGQDYTSKERDAASRAVMEHVYMCEFEEEIEESLPN